MSAAGWYAAAVAALLVGGFAAAMPWLDRRCVEWREVRAWRRACRGVTNGLSGPQEPWDTTDGLGDAPGLHDARTAPLRPSVGPCCTCGCWLTSMPAQIVDAEFAAIVTGYHQEQQ